MKAVPFYMIHNPLHEAKMTDATKLLKALVKIRSFSMCYCKHEQKKYVVSYKTSEGQDMQCNVNGRICYCIIFIFFLIFITLSTNEVLYLQKQALVGTLQKPVFLILTNIFAVL